MVSGVDGSTDPAARWSVSGSVMMTAPPYRPPKLNLWRNHRPPPCPPTGTSRQRRGRTMRLSEVGDRTRGTCPGRRDTGVQIGNPSEDGSGQGVFLQWPGVGRSEER